MTAIFYPYLGKAGAMRQLPAPSGEVSMPSPRGDTAHTLISGGAAATRMLHAKRSWTLPYDGLLDTQVSLLTGFHEGLYGVGPWRFVDPTVRNVLGLDVSSCGVRTTASLGWVASTGTIARTGTPPTGVDSGVLTWTGTAASANIHPGVTATTVDATKAPVYLPTEAVTGSMWVKTASAQSMTIALGRYDATGTFLGSTGTTFTSSTSWQQVSYTAAAGAAAFASAIYVVPYLLLGATAPSSVSIAGAQVEYGDTVTAWQRGYGSPQVVIVGDPGRSVTNFGFHSASLALAEV